MAEPYRILSLDGGPGTPTYTRYLRAIEKEVPGFLARAHMAAGTSDGSMAALYFAREPSVTPQNGYEVADRLVAFADSTFKAFSPGPRAALKAASGLAPLESNEKIEKHLESKYGATTKLGDLARHVSIVTYRLAGPYGPKIYHNFGRDKDRDARCVDVALQSGATPIALPIRQGCADGAVFANNPGMCAVATILGQREHHAKELRLEDLVMFSLGGDDLRFAGKKENKRLLTEKNVAWGWVPWIAHVANPLLLMELLLNSGGKGVAYQCKQLLEGRFHRLAVTPEGAPVLDFLSIVFDRTQRVIDEAELMAGRWVNEPDSVEWSPNFETTVKWVREVWMR